MLERRNQSFFPVFLITCCNRYASKTQGVPLARGADAGALLPNAFSPFLSPPGWVSAVCNTLSPVRAWDVGAWVHSALWAPFPQLRRWRPRWWRRSRKPSKAAAGTAAACSAWRASCAPASRRATATRRTRCTGRSSSGGARPAALPLPPRPSRAFPRTQRNHICFAFLEASLLMPSNDYNFCVRECWDLVLCLSCRCWWKD